MGVESLVEVWPGDTIRITFGGLNGADAEVLSVAEGHGEATVRIITKVVVEQGDFELLARASTNARSERG